MSNKKLALGLLTENILMKSPGSKELLPIRKGFDSSFPIPIKACLCLGSFRVLKEPGLGEPFGKASLANTAFGLGRFISMRDRSCWIA